MDCHFLSTRRPAVSFLSAHAGCQRETLRHLMRTLCFFRHIHVFR
jgi:hypothetical protein